MSTTKFAGARELRDLEGPRRAGWPGVRVEHVEAPGGAETLESARSSQLRALVALGSLTPEDVDVQVVYGRVDEHDEISWPRYASLRVSAKRDEGSCVYEGDMVLDRTGPFGYTVRVLPSDPLLSGAGELGLVAVPAQGEGMVSGDLR